MISICRLIAISYLTFYYFNYQSTIENRICCLLRGNVFFLKEAIIPITLIFLCLIGTRLYSCSYLFTLCLLRNQMLRPINVSNQARTSSRTLVMLFSGSSNFSTGARLKRVQTRVVQECHIFDITNDSAMWNLCSVAIFK